MMNIRMELHHLKKQHLKIVSRLHDKIASLERKIYCLEESIKDKNLEIGLFQRDALLNAQKMRKLRNLLETEEQTEDEQEDQN